MLNILFLTPIQQGSGNIATAQRIKNGLKSYFENIILENSNNFKNYEQIKAKICVKIDLILCVHAYHSGRLFNQINDKNLPPLITIFGGTDIHSPNTDWLNIITNTIKLSRYLICFSQELMSLTIKLFPQCAKKCLIIPQAVLVSPKQDFKLFNYFKMNLECLKLITWMGSIRKVKDPLYIEPLLNQIYSIDNQICFIFAGYSLDDSLDKSLKRLQNLNKNFYYINGVSSNESHSLIELSWAFLNTSINEGMSLAILEAMKLKTPIIARNNFGNCSIIRHKYNGLVFDNHAEFIDNISCLLNDSRLREDLVLNAFNYVKDKHSIDNEINSYYNCIKSAMMSEGGEERDD
jgi:glycosyltransferase involved in cell wall biosynthesis